MVGCTEIVCSFGNPGEISGQDYTFFQRSRNLGQAGPVRSRERGSAQEDQWGLHRHGKIDIEVSMFVFVFEHD